MSETREALERDLASEVTEDRLTGDFVLFQRRRGHRHSTDDLLTAWYATRFVPEGRPARLLDLGSGIGSVGLALFWFARRVDAGARLRAVEAQEVSYRLLVANVAENGVAGEVAAIHGDLRDETHEGPFDVVTGSPPYFDARAGIVSSDSQRAHARFELRGDIRDYARAAERVLAPDGVFVFCFPTNDRTRAEAACEAAGLAAASSRDVVPRRGRAPLFSLFAYAKRGAPASARVEEPFVVREESGEHTEELIAARRLFGLCS